MRPYEFDLRVRADRDHIILTPVGELDLATAPRLDQALVHSQRRAKIVVLDLRELTFAAATGLQVVLDAYLRSQQRDSFCLTLVLPPGGPVARSFELAGLYDRLPFTPSMPQWAAVSSPQAA